MSPAAPDRSTQIICETGDFTLYRCPQPPDQNPVLVKVANARNPSQAVIRCLHHESETARGLNPALIVNALRLSKHHNRPALLLEDDGEQISVGGLMGTPMEVGPFLQLAIAAAVALGELHRHGLIHKDIKPQNLLYNARSGRVRITGLAIASRAPSEQQEPEPPEVIAGTLAYMAPEQTGRMNRAMDSRSDLYALGITFYEMLTGALPFSAKDPAGWVHCHIARQPMPPLERLHTIPEALSAVIMRLLEKAASERYQTARGLEADLRRCLDQWQDQGRILPFPLGIHDVPDRLIIPARLYGRQAAIDALLAAFQRVVATGKTELMLVSGYSGVGKSSVVNELQKSLLPAHGFFASGKFDQYKHDIPYATVAQALESLMRQILVQSDAGLADWRHALSEVLGPNGELMVSLVPELEHIIGKQPPAPQLPPQDAQNRFQRLFGRLLGVFARREHPLVFFIDDLQWLDTASLQLFEYLLTLPSLQYVLFIGAYRDNELDGCHPHARRLDAIRQAGTLTGRIALGPLGTDHITRLVADALHCPPAQAAPLAELVVEKTAGNPFFTLQFLSALTEEQLLEFDQQTSAWAWDLERIRAKGFTDNVVELMMEKLQRLSPATREALQWMACLGVGASLSTLSIVREKPADELQPALWEAVRAHLLLQTGDSFKFAHDRIQEAAYALIPEAMRAARHLQIGRLLLAHTDAAAENIFDLVNQFNRGIELVTTARERAALCKLNIVAGTKAKAAAAYEAAHDYLAVATHLLPAHAWSSRYKTAFPMHFNRAECEYLTGRFTQADESFRQLLHHGRSNLERARVYRLRLRLYQISGRYAEGMNTAAEALGLFGVNWPQNQTHYPAAVRAEREKLAVALHGRPIASLVDAPLITDQETLAILGLLVDVMPCVYIASSELFPLLTLKTINLCLLHGNAEESSFAYICYGMTLVGSFGDITAGFEFSELSVRLNERFNDLKLKGTLLYIHAAHINIWRRHVATSFPILERSLSACIDSGNFVYAGFFAFLKVWHHFEQGDPLEEVLHAAARCKALARETHNEVDYQIVRLEEQLVAALKGTLPAPASFDDSSFSEAQTLAVLSGAAFVSGTAYFHILKEIAAYLGEKYAEALEHASRAAAVLPAVMAFMIECTHHFYHALSLTATYGQASAADQQQHMRLLEDKQQKLKRWADNCPENYFNRYALVSAEIARIQGREIEAMHLYDQAIDSARAHGFIQNAALANELAARFYHERQFEHISHTYLREARDGYARWGADAKVRHLDQLYPWLEAKSPGQPGLIAAAPQQLDLMAVMKASHAISGEITLGRLVETLLRIVIENAGAQRAFLILSHQGELRIEAEAAPATDGNAVEVLPGGPVSGSARLPQSLIHYVARSGRKLILDDATADTLFSADEYIRRQKTKSLLCLPILQQNALAGMLYLENNLTTCAFTPDRLAVLELLAAQAAISLQNATLYSKLQLENQGRKHAEHALNQLNTELAARVDRRTVELRMTNEALRRESLRRAQAAADAARTQQQFFTFMSHLPGVAFLKDRDGKYLFANAQLVALFEGHSHDWAGKTDYDLWPKEAADRFVSSDQQVLNSGQPLRYMETVPHGGDYHYWLIHKFPLYDGNKTPLAVGGLAVEITDLKHTQSQLQAALEKEALLRKEIHHRVKNNLQIVSSLLFLQGRHVQDPGTLEVLLESQLRIRSIALIHEKLYQSSGLTKIEIETYLRQLAISLFASYRVSAEAVALKITAPGIFLCLDQTIPCGLIITELVSNALKYAFPNNRTGSIEITFQSTTDNLLELTVTDNGIGLPEGFDPDHARTLGVVLVRDLTHQLDGKLHFHNDNGTSVTIRFPKA